MQKRIQWKIEKRKVSDLKPYDKNPRIITDQGLDQLKASIDDIGFAQPVNVNTDNTILSGHARCQVLLREDPEQLIDVYVPDRTLTPKQEEAVIVRMNKNVAGTWDMEKLTLNFEMDDLLEWGFNTDDFIGLDIQVEKIDPQCDEDEIPEVKKNPVTKRGDIWLLGSHRVMCGDSTMVDDVEKLTDGKNIQALFTSPPYNAGQEVETTGKGEKYESHNDSMNDDDYFQLLKDFTSLSISKFDVSMVNIQQLATNKKVFIDYMHFFKDHLIDVAIWNKNYGTPMLPKNVMNCAFEYILFFSKDKNPKRVIKTAKLFQGTVNNVYHGPKNSGNEYAKIHRAMFPVHLPEYFLSTFTTGSIIDLFNGCGTTLIACEKIGRQYFGMDKDPLYIDTTIERWEKYTGKKAELLVGSI